MAARYGRDRARGRGRRKQSSENGGFLPILIAALSILAIAGMLGAYAYVSKHHLELDATTLCPAAGPTAVHAVLLDRSDPITPLQSQRLRQVLDKAINEAEVGERIDLFVLAGDGTQAMQPEISICRPRSDGNFVYENEKKMRNTYLDRFRKPLDEALASMMTPATSRTSPIMESVKAICVAAFGGLPKDVPAHLTIASDMIQFSPLLNHYKNKDFDDFALTASYREVLADCHRADVDVLYLVRPRDVRIQDRRHQLFWEKFFDHEDANLRSIEAI
jgi:hypothetical protein